MAVTNGFSFPTLPEYLSALKPTKTEERCIALRTPFMQLKQLGVGKQMGKKLEYSKCSYGSIKCCEYSFKKI